MTAKRFGLILGLAALAQACGVTPGDDPDAGDDGRCGTAICGADEVCLEGVCVPVDDGCVDADGDGYGRGCIAIDCNDTDPSVFPGSPEVCGDGVDNDCDGIVDNNAVCRPCDPSCTPGVDLCSGDLIARCDDSSGCATILSPVPCPGAEACRDGACVEVCLDEDGDGFAVDCDGEEDCDDADPSSYPGAPEVCDGADNNCDTRTDENFVCDEPCEDTCEAGASSCTSDGRSLMVCQDGPDGCYRWGTVACGEGRSCADATCVEAAVCVDQDGDSYGPACAAGDDCRNNDAGASPARPEVCDGVDNDCDGVVDDGGVCGACTAPGAGAPEPLAAEGSYAVSCGGLSHWSLPGIGGFAVVVGSDDGPLDVQAGVVSGGTFSAQASGRVSGDATIVIAPSSATTLRVNAPAGTRYHLAAAPLGGCDPDAYEPNASPGTATLLGEGPHAVVGSLCGSDLDYYQVSVTRGQVLTATAAAQGADGVLQLRVLRNDVEVTPTFGGPAGAGGTPDGAYAFFRTDLPGEYAIGVRSSGAASIPYALSIQAFDATCSDDANETAAGLDDDTIPTASALPSGASTSGVLCPGDYDVFNAGDLTGGHVTAPLTFTGANLDGLLVHDRLSGLSQVVATDDDNELFNNNISTPGTYYFVIHGRGPRDTTSYTFSHQ